MEHTERQPLQRQAAVVYHLFGRPLQCHGATLLVQSCMHSLYRVTVASTMKTLPDALSAGPILIRAYFRDIYKN